MKNLCSLTSPLKYHNYKNSVIHYGGKITENIFNKIRNKGSSKNHENNNNNSSNNIKSSRGSKRYTIAITSHSRQQRQGIDTSYFSSNAIITYPNERRCTGTLELIFPSYVAYAVTQVPDYQY